MVYTYIYIVYIYFFFDTIVDRNIWFLGLVRYIVSWKPRLKLNSEFNWYSNGSESLGTGVFCSQTCRDWLVYWALASRPLLRSESSPIDRCSIPIPFFLHFSIRVIRSLLEANLKSIKTYFFDRIKSSLGHPFIRKRKVAQVVAGDVERMKAFAVVLIQRSAWFYLESAHTSRHVLI